VAGGAQYLPRLRVLSDITSDGVLRRITGVTHGMWWWTWFGARLARLAAASKPVSGGGPGRHCCCGEHLRHPPCWRERKPGYLHIVLLIGGRLPVSGKSTAGAPGRGVGIAIMGTPGACAGRATASKRSEQTRALRCLAAIIGQQHLCVWRKLVRRRGDNISSGTKHALSAKWGGAYRLYRASNRAPTLACGASTSRRRRT